MFAKTLRRTAALKRACAQLQSQHRHGGSLSKNNHIENWNNWRGDSEKRFEFNGQFFTSLAACGIFPFTLYYILGSGERRKRDGHNGIPDNFRG